jgi:parallel beta helix pectate lyase-like protein
VHNNASNGILIASPNNGSRRAVIRNTVVTNSNVGISVGANTEVVISHSDISDNTTAGLVVSASTGSVAVDSTTIAHNGFAFQNSGTVRLSNSDIAYNATGWTGTINTFTNNRFTSNGAVGPLIPIGSLSNPTGEQ